jgi:hypothetical protein
MRLTPIHSILDNHFKRTKKPKRGDIALINNTITALGIVSGQKVAFKTIKKGWAEKNYSDCIEFWSV